MARPDELLTDIERSVFGRALVGSTILEAGVVGAASISVVQDWTEYGVHSPSWINAEKTKARKEAEETRRREEAEKKAAAEEAKAAEMRAAASNETAKASGKAAEPAQAAPAEAAKTEAKEVKQPPEIKPLPPKKGFEYGEDLSLD